MIWIERDTVTLILVLSQFSVDIVCYETTVLPFLSTVNAWVFSIPSLCKNHC